MTRSTRVLAYLALALLCAPACADDAAIEHVGGALQPMADHPSVVMESMTVDVSLTVETAAVDCAFSFRNSGPSTTVQVGFPESHSGEVGSNEPGGFTTFKTWVDGEEVPTTKEGLRVSSDGGSSQRWRVKKVAFAAGQTRHVRVTYSAPTGADITGNRFFSYRVGTGGSWKGPIGKVTVRLTADYDPFDWTFGLDGRLQKTDSGGYMWSTTNLEPDPGDMLSAGFSPAGVSLTAGPFETPSRYPLYRRNLRDGHFWVAARWLHSSIGADLYAIEWPDVRLTLGDRTVDLRVGDPSMLANGRRLPLPGAPCVEASRLMIPLADVSRALGAEVTYQPDERNIQVTLPIHSVLAQALPSHDAQRVFYVLANSLAGYTAPDLAFYDPAVLRDSCRQDPWIATGDFNGDGKKDVVVLLARQGALQLAAATSPGFILYGLRSWPSDSLDPNRLFFVLRTKPPGKVAHYADGETAPKSGRLDLKHDGIELIAWGKAASLYYWDESAPGWNKFRSVTVAD